MSERNSLAMRRACGHLRPPPQRAQKTETMKTNTLTPELRHQMDAYWRAANYLSVDLPVRQSV